MATEDTKGSAKGKTHRGHRRGKGKAKATGNAATAASSSSAPKTPADVQPKTIGNAFTSIPMPDGIVLPECVLKKTLSYETLGHILNKRNILDLKVMPAKHRLPGAKKE